MATEIRVPALGESVAEATVGRWLKAAGDTVGADEPVVELETDKVSIEVPAPAAGTLSERTVEEGESVEVGALLGTIDASAETGAGDKRGSGTGDKAGSGAGDKPGRADEGGPAGSSSRGVSGGDGAPRSAEPAGKPVVQEARGTDSGAMKRTGAVPDDTGAKPGDAGAKPDDAGAKPDDAGAGRDQNTSDNEENGVAGKMVQVDVPSAGESVTEAEVGAIFKKVGDTVAVDEPILELETDKAAQDVMSPVAGTIRSLAVSTGDTVEVGAKLVEIEEGASDGASGANGSAEKAAGQGPSRTDPDGGRETPGAEGAPEKGAARAADQPGYGNAGTGAQNNEAVEKQGSSPSSGGSGTSMPPSPSAARMMEEKGVDASSVEGSGRRGQVLKGDVMAAMDRLETSSVPKRAKAPEGSGRELAEGEERVKMTRLRQTIARRLKEAQDTAAMLTTFNEVDMTAVMEMRKRYKELFEKKHGVKLGFMGFFTKAVCHALKEIPAVNAEIDGKDIVYKDFAHIGVAVGTDKGLVVPVVRNADAMGIAEVEKEIGRLGRAARDGELSMSDMQGGTFTISNGGVYGSLMSTPILNAPQSGILGMHKIQERPMVVGGEIVVRPMMYLALSYDHRIVDGKEAVTFLVRVKESLEDPERLVLDL